MTGSRSGVPDGVQMFNVRQSSLGGCENVMSPKIDPCIHWRPNSVASRTPSHEAAGCGSFQRRSPTGGAAYGIPLKLRIRPSALAMPRTVPVAVLTCAFETLAVTTMIAVTRIERDEIDMVSDHINHLLDLSPHVEPRQHTEAHPRLRRGEIGR